MPAIPNNLTVREQLAQLGRRWGWLVGTGIFFIALGVAAYFYPVASTVSLTFALGVIFIVGSIVRITQAIHFRNEIGTGWRVFDALLLLAAGVLILRYPSSGMLGVTIAMIFYFFMAAVSKFVVAFATRPLPGSGWAFVSALASLALAIFMIATFPIAALWVPGLLLGIEFVFYGISLIGVGLNVRTLHREVKQAAGIPTERRRVA